jgi:hypothetical protein
MHVAPPAIWIVVVPKGVTVMLGLCNPPRSWTDTVDPSLVNALVLDHAFLVRYPFPFKFF